MQILSLVWGILALVGMFIGFIPCLGALNWLNIPFAVIGLVISIVAYANDRTGSRNLALAGIICCALAILIGFKRLVAGGGIL
jgi:hypothetical protein